MGFPILPGVPDAHAVSYLVLLSVFLPYFISLIQQRHWSSVWRTRVSFAICAACSGAVLWNEGQLDAARWLTTAPLFFALTATLYSKFARKNGASALEDLSTRILQAWLGNKPVEEAPTHHSTPDATVPAATAPVASSLPDSPPAQGVEDEDVVDQST